MKAFRASLTIASCIACAAVLGACSASSPKTAASSSSANAWNGAPTTRAVRVSAKHSAVADAPIAKWSDNQTSGGKRTNEFALVRGGPHGAKIFALAGTGKSVAAEIYSPLISVKPGRYTFSAAVDQSKTSGVPTYLWVSNAGRNHLYGSGQIPPGQSGRFGFQVDIPKGVHEICVGFYTGGIRVKKGARLTFSQPVISNT